MLTQKDKKLIENYLGFQQGHPDAKPLTEQEQTLFDERSNDPEFSDYLQLSKEVDASIIDIANEGLIIANLQKKVDASIVDIANEELFMANLLKAEKGYHAKNL